MSRRPDSKTTRKTNGSNKEKGISVKHLNSIQQHKGRNEQHNTGIQQAQHKVKSNPVEIICLSDSEELDVIDNNPNSNRRLKNTNKKNSPSSSKSSGKSLPNGYTTPPQKDLESYYRSRGLSLSHVRRLNKNYVRHDGPSSEAGGLVFWDSFSPPPGFTVDDVPAFDSQGLSQAKEEIVSPAILNAAKYKMRSKALKKVEHSEAEFEELLCKLTKRKAEKENSPQPSKKSTPDPSFETSLVLESPNTSTSSFPSCDLNDSLLLQCTQAAEQEYINNSSEKDNHSTAIHSMEINQGKRIEQIHIKNISTGPVSTSTPVVNGGGSRSELKLTTTGIETPTSIQIAPCQSGRNMVWTSEFDTSVFDVSGPRSGRRTLRSQDSSANVPRKSLFGNETSACESQSPNRNALGDFVDDDDDELFSQIEIPNEDKTETENQMERNQADQSTLIINESDDSFLKHIDMLTEIDKLEEMALNSGNVNTKVKVSLADDAKFQQQKHNAVMQPSLSKLEVNSTRRTSLRRYPNGK